MSSRRSSPPRSADESAAETPWRLKNAATAASSSRSRAGPSTSSPSAASSAACISGAGAARVDGPQALDLGQQLRERWHVVVALEQYRHWARALECPGEQLVHRIGDGGPVGIDHDARRAGEVTGDVDLDDAVER